MGKYIKLHGISHSALYPDLLVNADLLCLTSYEKAILNICSNLGDVSISEVLALQGREPKSDPPEPTLEKS